MQIILPEKVQSIIHTLMANGYEAYAVGGCVRDSLLGRIPEDWDITTNAKPEELKALFSYTIDTGIEHGTVTVMMDHEGFEVTTYRIDGIYEDYRHPKQVEFTSNLREDQRRRDFTINALAYNPTEGIIDSFGGMEDLDRHIIRCVGDANERFTEDALRILRAIRFSAQLHFDIEEQTLSAIAGHAQRLRNISAERIRTELTKLLLSDHPERILTAYETGLTAVFLPEFDQMMQTTQENPHHVYDVGTHCVMALCHLTKDRFSHYSRKEQTALRYAALLHDVAKPNCKVVSETGRASFHGHAEQGTEMARAILRRLKFDNETIDLTVLLIREHDHRYCAPNETISPSAMRRIINRVGADHMELLFDLQEADLCAQNPELLSGKLRQLGAARSLYCDIMNAADCVSLKDLAINGRDLIAAGFEPGKTLGSLLQCLLEHVLEYPEDNRRDFLLDYAKKISEIG